MSRPEELQDNYRGFVPGRTVEGGPNWSRCTGTYDGVPEDVRFDINLHDSRTPIVTVTRHFAVKGIPVNAAMQVRDAEPEIPLPAVDFSIQLPGEPKPVTDVTVPMRELRLFPVPLADVVGVGRITKIEENSKVWKRMGSRNIFAMQNGAQVLLGIQYPNALQDPNSENQRHSFAAWMTFPNASSGGNERVRELREFFEDHYDLAMGRDDERIRFLSRMRNMLGRFNFDINVQPVYNLLDIQPGYKVATAA